MVDKIKIAAVQMDPLIMEIESNLDRILDQSRVAAANKADLIVFPECALSGYVYSSREEAIPYMVTVPGPATDRLVECAGELGVHIIVGLLEIDLETDRCYNAAVLVSPEGLIGHYRKTHLPFLGIDRFVDTGDEPFRVYDTPVGVIGMHICYDCNFPENARIMALLGAEILVLPTNWPQGRGKVADFVVNTRAYENKVHLVAVDRVGRECGASFIGRSKIINSLGDTLVEASLDREEIIYAEIYPTEAREKKIIFKPGEFELDFIGDRRPELYAGLVGQEE
ncbi:MAG: carbon-nitrogen hydrolase family protein [Dehalococcoidales bacterium]|jgi:predicted amidohydrolase|nr:carbon-nitrogen hydrolase family protein [Dehalococcoidales bacterium]